MTRLEIVANQSVQEEVVTTLKTAVPGITYTLIPVAHGRGGEDWRLGTTVWPEENFVLFTYQDDGVVELLRLLLVDLKTRFPREGMKWWSVRAED
jgi:hypothetical protein